MADLLEPVEGVTIEEWAGVMADIVGGTPKEEAVKDAGMDMPKWDRVTEEWQTRMKNDKTFTVTMKYSAAFSAPRPKKAKTAGSAPDIDPEAFTFEKYVESMVAQDILGKMGRDAQDVLKDFGLTVGQYSNISSYWSGKMMSDFSLAGRMAMLQTQYQQKYESMKNTDSNSDISF